MERRGEGAEARRLKVYTITTEGIAWRVSASRSISGLHSASDVDVFFPARSMRDIKVIHRRTEIRLLRRGVFRPSSIISDGAVGD